MKPAFHASYEPERGVGERAPHGSVLARSLRAERCDDTTELGVTNVIRREVSVEGPHAGSLPRDRAVLRGVRPRLGDELVAVPEMDVEPAVGQPHQLHELGDAHRLEAITPERTRGGLDDTGSHIVLVTVRITHGMIIIMQCA